MYHDEREIIMRAQTAVRNPEDKPWADLCTEELVANVEDFKCVMDIFNVFGDSERKFSNRILKKLIPTMIFLKSGHCETCCEYLCLGDRTSSYNLFQKLDRIYSKDGTFKWDLSRYFDTKKRMAENLHAVLSGFDISMSSFCKKTHLNSTMLTSMIYGNCNDTANGVPRKTAARRPTYEMTNLVYYKCLKELHYIFNTYELGFMFDVENWQLPEGIEWEGNLEIEKE